jgi:outer membrane protein assembly factor BamB
MRPSRRRFCAQLGASATWLALGAWTPGLRKVQAQTEGGSVGIPTFRGNASRSLQGFGPVPRQPRVRWSFVTGEHIESLSRGSRSWKGTGWSGQAAVGGGRVYVPGLDGVCYCRGAEDGAALWQRAVADSIKSSISLWDDRLLFGSRDDHLHCLARDDGRLLWSLSCGGKDVDSTPAVVGDRAWFGAEDTHVYCIDRAGRVLWRTATGGSIESSPSVVDGRVYVGSFDGRLHCLDAEDGARRWSFVTGDDTDSSPVVVGARLYVGCENGFVYCLEAASGTRLWRFRAGAGVWGTPAVVDGRLYIADDAGLLHCLDAGSGCPIWRASLGAGTWASPTVVDGCVVIGDWEGTLHCRSCQDGSQLWARPHAGSYIVSSACIVGGRIFIGVRDGSFYCLEDSL